MGAELGLTELYNAENCGLEAKVDIVAIHGIGADPLRTWTVNNINWLSDKEMLPRELPESRVLCFGYESQWLGKKAIRQRLPTVTTSLLRCLMEKRKICLQRPLVFIGHCFGGLVAEKAFLDAITYEHDYPGICNSTLGFLTLGTPHRGSASQSAAPRIATIASAFGYGDKKSLLSVIGEDSEIISDLVHSFVRSIIARGVTVCCFFEQQASDILKCLRPAALKWPAKKEIVVDEESACIPGVPRFGLTNNHFQMHRFTSNTDPNFRTVSDQIQEIVDKDSGRGSVRQEVKSFEESDQKALNALFQTDPRDDLERLQGESGNPNPATVAWIRDQQSYGKWQKSYNQKALFIVGNPGKGKTVIAASQVREEQNESLRLDNIAAYFFCSSSDNRRNDVLAALRGIIYHICCQNPDLCKVLTTEYERQRDQMVSSPAALHTMWRLLHDIVRSSGLKQLSIVIDGLDECVPANVEKFLTLLQPYLGCQDDQTSIHHKSDIFDSRIRWFITSRKEEFVTAYLEYALTIDLEENADLVQEAVHQFIDGKVESLAKVKNYNDSLKTFVQCTLKEKAEGTFLWVALVCQELSKPRIRTLNTKTVLSKFPAGLGPLYGRIVEQVLCAEESIDEDMVTYAKQILHALAIAFRPLTLIELAISAGLPTDIWLSEELICDCLRSCGSLVSVQGDIVRFVHASAKTYVLSVGDIVPQTESLGHEDVAIRCFDVIFRSNLQASLTYDQILYQVLFWPEHVRRAASTVEKHILDSRNYSAISSTTREQWFDRQWELNHSATELKPRNMGLLIINAYLGLDFAVKDTLRHQCVLPSQGRDSSMNTPLIWATKMGHLKTVEALLSYGVELNAVNDVRQTASHYASANGRADILTSLANSGANLQIADENGWTPLHRAVNSLHESCVSLLIDKGAGLEIKDYASWTPLQRASSGGKICILSTLIQAGANVEVRDREGMSALQTAAWNGHKDVAQALLDRGAAIDVQDHEGWTALHHSCWAGDVETTKLLLNRGAQVDRRNFERNTPLFLATWNGHHAVVQLLVTYGAQIDAFCEEGETALMEAAWAGHISLLKLLIDNGAAVNTVTPTGISALHQASSNGQIDATQFLLHAGADPNLQDADGQTACQYAQENSYPSTAQILHNMESPTLDKGDFNGDSQKSIKLDDAVAKALSVTPQSCLVLPHGHACSSSPWKVQVIGESQQQYFLKTTMVNDEMFKGEFESLKALKAAVPSICPTPILYGNLAESEGTFLLTQFVDVDRKVRGSVGSHPMSFAQKLATLHLSPPSFNGEKISSFGFYSKTFAGPIEQCNDWKSSWAEFFADNRLRYVASAVSARHNGEQALTDRVEKVAIQVVPKLLADDHLNGGQGVTPSLVHGDLWSGNKARGVINGDPSRDQSPEDYAFDASCSFAHSEYDLSLMRMFGGFSSGFFTEYHKLVPKTAPVAEYEDRMLLYQLYHWLINYAISGGGFKEEAMTCMDKLLSKYGDEE